MTSEMPYTLIAAIITCITAGISLVKELMFGKHKAKNSDPASTPSQSAPSNPDITCSPRHKPQNNFHDRLQVWLELVLSVMSTMAFIWLLVLAATLPAASPHRITAMVGCMVVVACGLRRAK